MIRRKLGKLFAVLVAGSATAYTLTSYEKSTIEYNEIYLAIAAVAGLYGAFEFIRLLILMFTPEIEGQLKEELHRVEKEVETLKQNYTSRISPVDSYSYPVTDHDGEQRVTKTSTKIPQHVMDKLEVEASESVRSTLSSLATETEVRNFITHKYPDVPKWMIDKLVLKELKRRGIVVAG